MRANRLLIIAALGVALRLAFGLGYWVDQPLTRDEREYLSLARSLRAGDGFVYDAAVRNGPTDPFGRAPGYPAFLAWAGGGGPDVPSSVPTLVTVTQSLVAGIGILLVAALATRLAGPRAGVYAAIFTAVYPPLIWISAYAFSEALFWPLGLFTVWLFDRADSAAPDRQPRLALLCGLVAGIGVLIRPALLFFLMLAAPYWLWRRRWMPLGALTLGALVTVMPWTIRNFEAHGRFVLVASEGGVTFWTGNHPLAIGEGDMAANPAIKRDSLQLRARYADLNEEAMEPIYYREALTWIQSHPLAWLGLQARKVFYTVVPTGPSYRLHSRLYLTASIVSYALALLAALTGVWRWRDRLGRLPGLWLLVGSAVLICLVFFPQERFRIPVIDPALLILAAAACVPRRSQVPA